MSRAVWEDLTIVTSCRGYGKYLAVWATSVRDQTVKPGAVYIFTHGKDARDIQLAAGAVQRIQRAGIPAHHVHDPAVLDFGTARNRAVGLSQTEWVMHLDADDALMTHAVEEFVRIAPEADVIAAGYRRSGQLSAGPTRRERLYKDSTGLEAFSIGSMCSGVSPFRRSFWERSPYRTDMMGAWDTALWFGFARLGARFRATKRAVFFYNQHADSIFNKRRRLHNWIRARTTAQLKSLRRGDTGVAVLVPRDQFGAKDRARVWARVRAHYQTHHPDWAIVEGFCKTPTWCKGEAIADALTRTTADVIVLADADCMVDPEALRQAVAAVGAGAAPWAMPHRDVYRATKEMTLSQYLTDDPAAPLVLPDRHSVAREVYEGFLGGGIVVTRRVWYEAIGGIPRVFKGWGNEDQALATACLSLLGPCARGSADLLHLWHEPQLTRKTNPANLQVLRKIGAAAKNGPDALVATLATMSALPQPTKVRRAGLGMVASRPSSLLSSRRRRAP